MCRHLILIWFALLAGSFSSTAFAQWHNVPILPGSYSNLTCDSSGEKIYVTVDGAGVWYTDDGGDSWQPVSHRLWPGGGVKSAAVHSLSSRMDTLVAQLDVNYHGPDDSYGLSRFSYNGGNSWQAFDTTSARAEIQFWRANPSVWLRLAGGFSISTDGGQTWIVRAQDVSDGEELIQHPTLDSCLLVIGYDQLYRTGVIRRSWDLGATWQRVFAADDFFEGYPDYMLGVNDLCVTDSGRLLVAMQYGLPSAVLLSDDVGDSWRFASTPLWGLWDVTVAGNRIFAAGRTLGGMWYSDDGGDHWGYNLIGLPNDTVEGHSVAADPTGETLVLSDFDGGLYQSRDNGRTWSSLVGPPAGGEVDRKGFRFSPTLITMAGPRWRPAPTLRSPFLNWTFVNIPTGIANQRAASGLYDQEDTLHSMISISVPDDSYEYCCALHATTTDRGRAWSLGDTISHGLSPFVLAVHRTANGVRLVTSTYSLGSGPDTLFYSDDYGETWLQLGTRLFDVGQITVNDSAIFVYDGDVWGSFGHTEMYYSSDVGEHWHTLRLPDNINRANFLHGGICIVEYYGDRLYRYHEGSWEQTGSAPMRGTNPYSVWNIIGVPGAPDLLVGAQSDYNDVFVSEDYGATWQMLDVELPYYTQNTYLEPIGHDPYRNTVWFDAGIGPCYLPVEDLLATGPVHLIPASHELLSVYPNPFNSETTIRYELPREQEITLALYNIEGRRVKSLVSAKQAAGSHTLKLDAAEFASGVYFVSLSGSNLHKTEKLLLLK